MIFDCDGVLVDSEPIAVAVLSETMRAAGLSLTLEDVYARFLGRSLGAIRTDLAEADGLVLTDPQLAAMRLRLAERFMAELRPIAGVADAVQAIGAPVCVASSSQPERLALALGVTGLAPLFGGRVFSATEVAAGKPAPDLFLHAAARMNANPAAAVVVEDSPAGVRAARAAGMSVIGFAGGGHAGPAQLSRTLAALGPDALIDDMSALGPAITELTGR
ncbi:6-phosphogluconate phosphatase [Roseivivax jejudonensis]|uniref:6-phosphogluconate phosphatase n=1 Tax=Roseivivax jejudonensis TaxID=1529041 RepID=A0A1X6YRX8_9RHOB|nr:HAD-IA family hydrolase [Roseivivax jejudonensis]SLN29390.1 6-phosphogluconate phosphatase [Roseivivax jejudonensis]